MKDCNLAFETDNLESSNTIYRLMSWRESCGRTLRHTNWFATEEAARKHAAWINDGRGEVIGLWKYDMDKNFSEEVK